MILHFFSPIGWEQWDLCERPFIRDKMPVLIDEDLRFEDGRGPRPATVMNRWLRELPISGAPSPNSWRTYAQALKSWAEYLGAHRIPLFADRQQLRDGLSLYAEHRLSGPPGARLSPASWNLAVKTISAFYLWAAAEGHLLAVPFSYAQQFVRRPDSARVENSHTRRGVLPLSGAAPTSSYPSPGIPARRVAPLPGLAQPGAGPSISTSGQAWPEVGLRALPSPGRVREAMAPTSAMPAPATIAR